MLRATAVTRRMKPDARDRAGRVAFATVTLDRASRYRRRIAMTTDQGAPFLLDLAEATHLADGDWLVCDDGTTIRVVAAAEPLLEVTAEGAVALARIAWHIGNRHTPCEVTEAALYIQPDHVLAEMVCGLGGRVRDVTRPFEPEGGAYGGRGPLQHGHHHHGGHHDGHHHHDHATAGGNGRAEVAAPHPLRPAVWRP